MAVPIGFMHHSEIVADASPAKSLSGFDFENNRYYAKVRAGSPNYSLYIKHTNPLGGVALTTHIDTEGYMPKKSYEAVSGGATAVFDVYVKKLPTGKISEQSSGTIIDFAGSTWMILNPTTGYVRKNDNIGQMYFDTSRGRTLNPNVAGNVAHYLNNTFLNSLPEKSRISLITKSWGTGGLTSFEAGRGVSPTLNPTHMENKERTSVVSLKVGILSVSEYRKYGNLPYGAPGMGILGADAEQWLSTPYSDNGSSIYAARDGILTYDLPEVFKKAIYPTAYIDPELLINNGEVQYNKIPSIVLDTSNNQTLYENSIFTINGTTTDEDNGDVLTIKYQINSGVVRNLHSGISDRVTPIQFSKELRYTDGVLKDGASNLTSVLSAGTPHVISVWSEDGNGGKSAVESRTFYVVPNRPPTLTIDPIAPQSDLINSNVIPINGTVGDLDNNNVIVTFQINDGLPQEVLNGVPGIFAFNIVLKDLKSGANTVVIKATDIYDAAVSKVLTINKTHNAVPVNNAIALYKITPPTGSAQKILMWIEQVLGDLAVTAEVSMTNAGEPENFVSLPKTNTGPKESLQEDEFAYDALAPKTNIVVKIIYNRTSSAAVETIKKISGVLS